MTDILIRNVDSKTLQIIEVLAAGQSLKIVKKETAQEKRVALLEELNALANISLLSEKQTPSLDLLHEDRMR